MPPPRYSAAQHAVRSLAGVLPLGLLAALLVPVAAVRAARFVRREGRARAALLGRLPSPARPLRWPHTRIWLDRARVELTWLSWTCRDRFHHRRWTRRIAWAGEHHVTSALAAGRPVVLATVHYGPLTFLGRLMCARGWTVGALADRREWIDPRTRRAPDGRRIAPRIFLPRHARRVLRFLGRGGAVIVAMDFPRGRLAPVAIGGRVLPLSTGGLRLAAAARAVVIPCVARERWLWRAAVTFFPPVPGDLVADPALHPAACQHIADAIAPAITTDPMPCGDLLLEQFRPLPAVRPAPLVI
jgi:lauroyl/myristoyl acyltransferase